jgi:CubicO group peptidase (beta-lactamase class C family)
LYADDFRVGYFRIDVASGFAGRVRRDQVKAILCKLRRKHFISKGVLCNMTGLQPPARLRNMIEQYLLPLPEKVQVAIALVEEGATRFIGAERTLEGVRYLDNRSAVFEIGSITKVFTATLLACEVVQNALRLDMPVQELLPLQLRQAQRGGVAVTLKHLANHTSGIRHHQPPFLFWYALLHGQRREPFREYSTERFERYLRRQMKLAFVPGERYKYSNMGMSLLGYALSVTSGQDYEQLLQEQLFRPLGMSLSTTHVSGVQRHVVAGLEKAGVSAPNWDMYALSPAGGIKTCAEDFAKFVGSQFSREPAIAMTQSPTFKIEGKYDNNFVGLGWHIIERKGREPLIQHGGGMLGYTAQVRINVIRKRGVIVLSNLGHREWQTRIAELARDLQNLLEESDQSLMDGG